MKKLLGLDFIRFCIVGVSGFLINLVLLTLLHKSLQLPLFISQLISSEIALFSNFLLHHNWTYKQHKVTKSVPTLLFQFHAASWAAILGSSAIVDLGVRIFNLHYIVALVIASGVALGWNFLWSKFVIWKREHHQPPDTTGVEEAA